MTNNPETEPADPQPVQWKIPLLNVSLNRPGYADTLILILLLAASYTVSRWDVNIVNALRDLRVDDTTFRRSLTVVGKAEIAFLFVIMLCWITGNRRFLWRYAWSGAIAGLVVTVMKLAIARERPRASDFDSFPSGHSQVAFVFAVIVAAEFPKFAVPAFAAAIGIGLFRITSEAHFPSDVFAGAAIGFFVARMVVRNVDTVPRWLYRLTRRTGAGLAGAAAFVIYIAYTGKDALLAAAVIVPIAAAAVAYRDRKSLKRFFRRLFKGKE